MAKQHNSLVLLV